MFDDIDDIEDFQVDVKKPRCLAIELIAAAKAGDVRREKMALGALDDALERVVHNAGEGKPGAMPAFQQWLTLLVESIRGLAEDDMKHFVWEYKGNGLTTERPGAVLVRRLQHTVNSGTFDRVKVTQPAGEDRKGEVVLMLGRGGVQFDDVEAAVEFWTKKGCTVIQANHCGLKRLKEKEMDRIMEAMVDEKVATRGLLIHVFSENGSYFWTHVLGRWASCPATGLPPVQDVLRGCVYDSAQLTMFNQSGPVEMYKGAAGDMTYIKEHRTNARKGSARHVTMNAALAMCRNVFGPDSDFVQAMADISGPLFKGIVEAHAHRSGIDDPIFDNGHTDMMIGILREPTSVPRLMFVSRGDTTLSYENAEYTVAWMEKERGAHIEFHGYETCMNCSMHRDDPEGYWAKVGDWYVNVARKQAASD